MQEKKPNRDTIKVSPDVHTWVEDESRRLKRELHRPVSMNEVLQALIAERSGTKNLQLPGPNQRTNGHSASSVREVLERHLQTAVDGVVKELSEDGGSKRNSADPIETFEQRIDEADEDADASGRPSSEGGEPGGGVPRKAKRPPKSGGRGGAK